jgi:PAS domain S-box-containing protein
MVAAAAVTGRTDRAGRGEAPATGRSGPVLSPVWRLVAVVLAVGLASTALVVWTVPSAGPVLSPGWLAGPWLFPGLLALVCAGELTAVKVRQGDAVEELALYEPAVLVAALLLPLHLALTAAVLALFVATALRRRPLVKTCFNFGTYMTATSALIAVVALVSGGSGELTARVALGAALGTLAFSAVNLVCLSRVLALVTGVSPSAFVREQARLSVFMAAGCTATGMTIVALALHTPVLLPVSAMPALALTFAYRSTAQEADERARSATLLQLTEALAEPDDLLPRVLALSLEAFGADLAVVVLTDGSSATVHAPGFEAPAAEALRLAGRRAERGAPHVLTRDELPAGCGSGLLVPVTVDRATSGRLLLGARRRRRGLASRELALLAPVASALGAALVRAEHLARIREEAGKLSAVVEQSTDGILLLDGQGTVQLWSPALAGITGILPQDALGRPATALLVDADLPAVLPGGVAGAPLVLPVTPERPTAVVETTVLRPDGERRRVRCSHSAVFTSTGMDRDVVLVHDLTREHETQRLKSDFIATVSHELRTPLTPIKGYLDLLLTRGDRMTEQKRRDCLSLVADRADHLARLVEDLLLASRLDDDRAGLQLQVSSDHHDLLDVVRQVVDDLDEPRCSLVLPADVAHVGVVVDRERTVQVLTNLVGNALKYSGSDAPVEVAVVVLDDQVEVRVVDCGPGIPSTHLGRIFDKFHRVQDPMTMTTGGSGLGLYIARSLARSMSGDISVASTLGVGSTFTLCLPVAAPALAHHPTGGHGRATDVR